MYRKTIEHPEYLPEETRRHTDFEGGKGYGRIWRVMTQDARSRAQTAVRNINLAKANTRQLVAALSHSNAWHRQTAHRLLVERKPSPAAQPLAALARNPRSSAQGRFLALNLLAVCGALDESTLTHALADMLEQNIPPSEVEFMAELGRLVATEAMAMELAAAMDKLAGEAVSLSPAIRIAALDGIMTGARARQIVLPFDRARVLVAPAKALLADATGTLPVRKAAAGFLASSGEEDAVAALLKVLDPHEPGDLQQSVIRLLAGLSDSRAVQMLLARERWEVLAPATRATEINTLLAQPRHTLVLLDAVESGWIPASVLTSRQRDQLRQHTDAAVRNRARMLLAAFGGNRMEAYEKSKAALQLKGDPANGKNIFGRVCASCHRLDRQGVIVGPDLVSMRRQAKEVILLHVINPNYEVAPPFAAYEIETADGRSLTGLLASETPTSVTLRQAQGIEEIIRRADINRLVATPLSLMPEELEKNMSQQELADLLAYLRGE